MIAPVYKQNENGRMVYFPEPMLQLTWKDGRLISQKKIAKGDHYIAQPLDCVVFFVRKGKAVPLFEPAMNTAALKRDKYQLFGKGKYKLYEDDGFTSDVHLEGRIRILK